VPAKGADYAYNIFIHHIRADTEGFALCCLDFLACIDVYEVMHYNVSARYVHRDA